MKPLIDITAQSSKEDYAKEIEALQERIDAMDENDDPLDKVILVEYLNGMKERSNYMFQTDYKLAEVPKIGKASKKKKGKKEEEEEEEEEEDEEEEDEEDEEEGEEDEELPIIDDEDQK